MQLEQILADAKQSEGEYLSMVEQIDARVKGIDAKCAEVDEYFKGLQTEKNQIVSQKALALQSIGVLRKLTGRDPEGNPIPEAVLEPTDGTPFEEVKSKK